MFRKILQILNYFIPPNLRTESYIHYRALAFVVVKLFFIVSIATLDITARLLSLENDPNLILCLFAMCFILFIMRRYGNLILSGNLSAALSFFLLAPSVSNTGGLYSDNLLWMILAPMIALLFSNKISGLVWLLLLVAFTTYQYAFYTDVHILSSIKFSNSTYYFTSYLGLFLFIYGIIIIFERGQGLIIAMLSKQKQELELQKQEIIKKNTELELAEEKLRLSNQELENFAYIASHDMREPLRMIGMYSQLTQKKLDLDSQKSAIEYMGYVNQGVNRLQNLLNDLLDYSRLGKDVKSHKVLDLNNTIYSVLYNLMATIKDANASIITDKLPNTMACSSEMNQLFQNIIANAIKFRKKGIDPIIEIRSGEVEDNYLFSIKDNGIGIKEEHKEKVFNIFEKLHAKHQYEGSGIGLATCRKIVQSMGGTIWLESTEGVGTTFFFTIPKEKIIIKNAEIDADLELV